MRILNAVAELQSIGRAARAFGIAQPALSRHLKALEATVGATLLDRGAKGVSLNLAGRAVVARAAAIDGVLARAVGDARRTAQGRLGRLRVGLGSIAMQDPRVGLALRALREREPAIELAIEFIGSPQHTSALLRDQVDFVIGTEETPAHRRVSRRVLDVEFIACAALAEDGALSRRAVLDPSDLHGLPVLLAGKSAGWVFPQVRARLRKLGVAEVIEVDTLETAFAYAAAGNGWVPVARSYRAAPPDGTVAIPLRGLDVELPLLMRWRQGDDSPLLARSTRIIARAFPAERGAAAGSGHTEPGMAGRAERASSPEASADGRIDGVEVRHLRALVAIAEEGSVGDAARRLGVTQSAVSRQLSALERFVGTPLFRRSRTGMSSSPAGEVMRAGAVTVLRMLDEAVSDARLSARGIERRCVIGILPSPIASHVLRDLLRRATRDLPLIAIEVRESTSTRLAELLRRGEVDVALMMFRDVEAPHPELRARFIANDAYDTILVSEKGPLARRATVVAAELRDLPFCHVPLPEHQRAQDPLILRLRKMGVDPLLIAPYDGPRAIWRAVADGSGWALGVRSMRAKPPAGIVGLSLEGLAIPASLHVVSRADEPNAHVRALAAAL